jgi:alpha-galactosidase
MREILWVCLIFAFAAYSLDTAWGVEPSGDEMTAARDWVRERIGNGAVESFPFSFEYDGSRSTDVLKRCTLDRQERELDEARTERILRLADPQTGLEITCRLVEYKDCPAAEWVLTFRNNGTEDTPILEHILPLDACLTDADWVLHHALGESNSAESFAPREERLAKDSAAPYVLAPNGGRSSDGHMPFFNLQSPTGGVAIAIGWSGQWEARFQRDEKGALRVQCGMQTTHLLLHPGESIRTPSILLSFWRGGDPVRGNNLFRRLMLAHYLPRRNGDLVFPPICGSVNEVAPDGSYEGPHIRVMAPLARRGIEVFWSDMDPQQWYPGGFPDGTGTWEPDPAKYPRGLAPIGEAAHGAGLGYLLWFEPERVAAGSRIAKEHPEWVTGAEKGGLFKLHLPEARAWLTDYIDKQVTAARLDWIRWDFNIEPLNYWKQNDTPDRQGMTEIRHIEALYAMWDDLMKRHPGLLIDVCASGGRRIDIETMKRGLPLWHSDLQCSGPHPAADQLQNGGLFPWAPMHGCGVFGYEPSYVFRSAMTAGNILAVSGSKGLSTADPDTEEAVMRTVALYKKLRPYMLGDFHPLFPHSAREEDWYGYQFHREDLDAGFAVLFRREKCAADSTQLALHMIDPQKEYEVNDASDTKIVKGDALRSLLVTIPSVPGSTIVWYGAAAKSHAEAGNRSESSVH